MGQQQVLLVVLAIILVSIATVVGVTIFKGQTNQSSVDAMVSDLNNFGAAAQQYRMKPKSLGGGAGTFTDFSEHFILLADNLTETDSDPTIRNVNATYILTKEEDTELIITAVSSFNPSIKRSIAIYTNGDTDLFIPSED